jgi:hypothetical protein
MLQQDGVVMVKMKVLVMRMMVMMIPMKSSMMMMTMVMISPLREGISLADFCLSESFSLSSVFRPAEAAVSISQPPGGEAVLWPLSPPPSGSFSLLAKYNFLVFFWNFLIFENMVSWWSFFQQNPYSGSKSCNDHQTCKNRGNNISIISKCEIYQ